MRRIRLHQGVWTTFLGLVGGGAVTLWPSQIMIGYALIAAAILLAIWGLTIDGGHWWKRIPRLKLPFHRRGQMYIGQILAFDTELDSQHILNLAVRGYNGTGRKRKVLRVEGQIKMGPQEIVLMPPALHSTSDILLPDAEFVFNLRQSLTPDQVSQFRALEAEGKDVLLAFDRLNITTKNALFGTAERIELWDGISLRHGRFWGRIISASITSKLGSGVIIR